MNFGQLLEEVFISLRQVRRRGVVTGGTTTTLVDSALEDSYRDGGLDDSPLFISRTTDDLAPVHEYAKVTTYTEADWTMTFPALTAAPAAGDRYTVMQTQYDLFEVEKICNMALKEIGLLPYQNATITTADAQREYTIPLALEGRELLNVEIQTKIGDADDNDYEPLYGSRVIPSAIGVAEVLQLKTQPIAGRLLRLTYVDEHADLTAFNSELNRYIHTQLAVAVCRYKVLEYLGVWNEEQESNIELRRAEEAYLNARDRYPIRIGPKRQSFFQWGKV